MKLGLLLQYDIQNTLQLFFSITDTHWDVNIKVKFTEVQKTTKLRDGARISTGK